MAYNHSGMNVERPSAISPKWCPDCGEEMRFSGTQSAGYAQFFCEPCRYRRDTFVGVATVEALGEGGVASAESDETAVDSD